MYVERTLGRHLIRVSEQFPVVLVTGARQVGKTTLLRRICEPDRTYVSLDDPRLLSLAKSDTALFFQLSLNPNEI